MKKTFMYIGILVGIFSFAPQALAPEMHDTDRGKSPWAVDIECLPSAKVGEFDRLQFQGYSH